MRQPVTPRLSFPRGVVIAIALTFASVIVHHGLLFFIPAYDALRVTLAALAGLYGACLFHATQSRAGRVSLAVVWLGGLSALALLDPPISVHLVFHIGCIWLARTVLRYPGLAPASVDFVLTVLATAAALGALGHGAGLAMAIWCFFLIQSLTGFISGAFRAPAHTADAFDRAYRLGEQALTRLTPLSPHDLTHWRSHR